MNKKLLFIIFILFSAFSCNEHAGSETTVYYNDFELGNLNNIANGQTDQFNGSSVLGRFNNGHFVLTVNNLPHHDEITISFDLYIHNSWDGNKLPPDGPDRWEMLVDGNSYINTTFSNDPCTGSLCSPQSFPFNYPNNYNNAKTGAYRTDLPGVCSMQNMPGWTTQYKITKTITHSAGTLQLQCLDQLVQTNSNDVKCDESWSVDNISIKAISL